MAKAYLDAIQLRVKTIDTEELEGRLAELEETVSTADPDGNRNMRRL